MGIRGFWAMTWRRNLGDMYHIYDEMEPSRGLGRGIRRDRLSVVVVEVVVVAGNNREMKSYTKLKVLQEPCKMQKH